MTKPTQLQLQTQLTNIYQKLQRSLRDGHFLFDRFDIEYDKILKHLHDIIEQIQKRTFLYCLFAFERRTGWRRKTARVQLAPLHRSFLLHRYFDKNLLQIIFSYLFINKTDSNDSTTHANRLTAYVLFNLFHSEQITALDISTNNFKNTIGDEGIKNLAPILPQCPRLTSLKINCHKIGDEGIRDLAPVLPQCPQLAYLDLSYNSLGDTGMSYLAAVLPQCKQLTTLKLGDNSISHKGISELAPVLPQCPKLACLDFHLNFRINDEGIRNLAPVLPQCRQLTTLILCSTFISDVGIRHLATVLPQCPRIVHLELHANKITHTGISYLAPVLPQCKQLTTLKLGSNCDDNGNSISASITTLANVLPLCKKLAWLSLYQSKIDDTGASDLATVLPQCLQLAYLDLNFNRLGDTGIRSLATALPQCTQLNRLRVEMENFKNKVNDISREALCKAILKNYSLRKTPTAHITSFWYPKAVLEHIKQNRIRYHLMQNIEQLNQNNSAALAQECNHNEDIKQDNPDTKFCPEHRSRVSTTEAISSFTKLIDDLQQLEQALHVIQSQDETSIQTEDSEYDTKQKTDYVNRITIFMQQQLRHAQRNLLSTLNALLPESIVENIHENPEDKNTQILCAFLQNCLDLTEKIEPTTPSVDTDSKLDTEYNPTIHVDDISIREKLSGLILKNTTLMDNAATSHQPTMQIDIVAFDEKSSLSSSENNTLSRQLKRCNHILKAINEQQNILALIDGYLEVLPKTEEEQINHSWITSAASFFSCNNNSPKIADDNSSQTDSSSTSTNNNPIQTETIDESEYMEPPKHSDGYDKDTHFGL